ncbi:MAG: murein biosynthesis integral membrane protein MurJ [Deltaproteobacteria bacterium]|nr:murein biosynthesis integral membrane protein MurJ [Deltaproteobacteria bacterium]
MTRARKLGATAALLAGSVLLSRVLGNAREILLAHQIGAGAETDAYNAAFQIPDLLNYFLAGGALSVAFLPSYARLVAKGETEAAQRFFGTVLGTLGAIALLATLLLWIFAEPLVDLQFPGFSATTRALTVRMTRIVLPAQVFFITGGIVNATLMALGRFRAQALSPLIYNACIILGGLVLAPSLGAEGFSWGALLGALLGPFLLPLVDLYRGAKLRIAPRFAPTDRALLAYLWLAAPLMLGQTLLTVDEWYGRWFGAMLGAGRVAELGFARKLMLVPVAVVGQAVATAALPTLARLWAERRERELHEVVLDTLRAATGLAILLAGAVIVLAPDLVTVVFRHGAFSADAAVSVGRILSILSLAIPFWVLQQIVTRAFYAREDTWRPMILGTVIAAISIPMYWVLGHRLGVTGLAWAGVIGMTTNAVASLILARVVHGGPSLGAFCGTFARACLISTAASLGAYATLFAVDASLDAVMLWARGPGPATDLDPSSGMLWVLALVRSAIAGLFFLALSYGLVRLFGDEAMKSALARVVRRFSARRGRAAPKDPV